MRLAALLVLAALSAAAPAAEPAKAVPAAPKPIDWSAYPRPPKTGDFDDQLQNPQTHEFIMKFRMRAPTALPEQPVLGVVLCFHGANGNETHIPDYLRDKMKEAGLDQRYLIVGLKSKGATWTEADEPYVLQFADWLQTVYPVDQRRVFLWGMSNGGWMVSWFGGRHQDRFAGVVRWCGYPREVPQLPDAAATQTEYYLIHGDADEAVAVDGSRLLRWSLHDRGYRGVYREIDGGHHVDILDRRPIAVDAARWIDFLRHKQIAPSKPEVDFLRGLGDAKKAAAKLADAATWDEIARIGGPPAAQVVARCARADDAAVRADAAKACARTSFAGDDTVALLAKLADDADATVRSAALDALAVHANWHSDPAQAALCRVAGLKKRDPAERLRATSALAAALVLPLYGNVDDDLTAFQGVFGLLDADEPALRAAAFAPLAAAVADGNGYHPEADASARRSPIGTWKAWYQDHLSDEAKHRLAQPPTTAKKK